MTPGPTPASLCRRLLAPIQRPTTSAVLLLLLLADCTVISAPRPATSVCGQAISQALSRVGMGPARATDLGGIWRPEYYACRAACEWSLGSVDGSVADWNAIAGTVLLYDRTTAWGYWAPTTARKVERLEIRDLNGALLPYPDRLVVRRLYAAARPDVSYLAQGDRISQMTLWSGYLHTAVAAGALVLFMLSLSWVDTLPKEIRTRRRLVAGLCPKCAYDLRSGALAACPECGWGGGP